MEHPTDLRELTFDATRNAAGFDAAAHALTRPALDAKDALITRLLAEKREIDQARITAERLNDGLRAKLAEVAALDQPGDQEGTT